MFLRRVAASGVGASISEKKRHVRHLVSGAINAKRMDHFAAKCNSTEKQRSVRVVDKETDEEVFTLSGVSNIEATQIVTLRLDSENYLRFQIDSGAQCNVVPMSLYKKATGDYERRLVTPVRTSIVAYGESKLPVRCVLGYHVDISNANWTVHSWTVI